MAYLGNTPPKVPLTSADITDSIITSAKIVDGTIALSDLSATGTKNATTFLRGDNSFATVSSDFVKLYTVTQSSFVSSTVIDGYFDDTIYASYELHISHMRGNNTANSIELRMRWYNSGAEQTGSNYRWLLNEGYAPTTSTTVGQNNRAGYDTTSWEQMQGTWKLSNDSSVSQQNYILQIFNPQDTSNAKHVISNYCVMADDGSRAVGVGFCTFNSTSSMSGLSFYNANSYSHKARWTLYGKKK